jgi:epsin
MDDLVDITSTSTAMPNAGPAAEPEIDLFATTAFQSANAPLETASGSHALDNIDLFAGRSSFADSVISDKEFSVRGNPNKSSGQNLSFPAQASGPAFDPSRPSVAIQFPSDTEFSGHHTRSGSLQEKNPTPEHSSAAVSDPFAAIPVKCFDGSDSFGAFSSNTGSVPTEVRHNPAGGIKISGHSPLEELDSGAFTSQTELPTASAMKSMNKSPKRVEPASLSASKSDVKKGTFQVKSDVWADSLSRGLINLNIAPQRSIFRMLGLLEG